MIAKSNKFLTFSLGEEPYGIQILKVKEIIRLMKITYVPRMPQAVKGVINLRGKIIPVIDLRTKFDFSGKDYDDRTCIIVVEIDTHLGTRLNGLVVDSVSEVLDIDASVIDPPPQYGDDPRQTFISGLGKVKEKVIMLLNIDKIIDNDEILMMHEAEQAV